MTGSPQSTLLRNVRAVFPGFVSEKTNLLVQDGFIRHVFDSHANKSSPAGSTLDLEGLTLCPGFIDVHIHGAAGVDTMEASKEDLSRVSQFLASHGVTGWLPTLVPAAPEDYESAVRVIEEVMNEGVCDQEGARVLGVHYEGPFVNSAQCGALRSAHFKSFFKASYIDELPTPKGVRAVRMMTLAPEIEGGVELVRELTKRGWIVAIGHTHSGIDVLDRAFAAGARHITHFMNAMPPLHHRAPGPVGWGLARNDVTCDVIADGIHLDPLVLGLLLRTKGSDRLSLISDAIAAAGQGDGEYKIWGETISVKDGRTRNERGSIAGSVITMLDAARMMRSLGVAETDLARMTATNPARLLRLDSDCGSIEAGKRADLFALDDAGDVRLTIIGGRMAFQA